VQRQRSEQRGQVLADVLRAARDMNPKKD